MTDPWPEWLTPEYTNMHTAIENEIKRALGHCYGSADASGLDWTMEGLFSVAANNILAAIRRAGSPPPQFDPVTAEPMPQGPIYDEDDWPDEEEDDLRAAVAAANQRADLLADAARDVVEEWGTDDWIRPTFESAIKALRALVADQPATREDTT